MISKFIAPAIVLCAFVLPLASADTPDSPRDVAENLSGVWEIESGVNQGDKVTEEELEGTRMIVKQQTIVTYDKEKKETYRATFTLDSSKQPVQIDMTTQMKDLPPTKAYGILKFDDENDLQICYALPGSARPTEFKSPEGSKIMLFECERED